MQDSVKDQFIKAVLDETNKIKVGNGLEDGIVMGPLIADRRIEIMDSFVKDAVDSGAELNLGGHRPVSYTHLTLPTICSV